MSDAGNLPRIDVEPVFDDEAINEDEGAVEVERIPIRDEARVMAWVSLISIGVGVLFTIGWFFVAWRTQSELSGGERASITGLGAGDPDLVDRIYALEQIGILLLFAMALVVAGCGLRLYATRVKADRDG